jgi:hypothetical protein
MIAIRALDLSAGELLINLQVLFAMRTGKFEVAHFEAVVVLSFLR